MLGGWLVAIGSITVIVTFFFMARLNRVKRWQAATATVTRADYEEADDLYRLRIAYRFTVRGAEYQGDRVSLRTDALVDLEACQSWMERFPVGSNHLIYYDPKDPSVNALSRELDPRSAGFSALGLSIGLVALAAGLWFFQSEEWWVRGEDKPMLRKTDVR